MHPERPARIRQQFAPLHRFFVNKWYFDEAIDFLVVRPFAWFGRWARNTFERVVVNGAIVGGAAGAVRAGSAAVRAIQTGLPALLRRAAAARARRPRPLLPDLGVMTVHLSILLFWPLAAGVIGGLLAARRGRASSGSSARSSRSCYAVMLLIDFDAAQAGLQYVTDDAWIPELGHPLQARRSTG